MSVHSDLTRPLVYNGIGRDGFRIAAPAAAAAIVAVAGMVALSLTVTGEGRDAAPAPVAQSEPLTPAPRPSGMPGIAQDQTPAAGVEVGMEIVVKFRDDASVKEICDLYWKDADAARTKFSSFKRRWPEFTDMQLDRVTYSNELVLVSISNAPPQAVRQAARAIQTLPAIAYAEPNPTAFPGDRK